MTWWMRPGPSRFCAMRKPSPGSPSVFATGTRTSVKRVSQCVPQPRPSCPITEHLAHELVARGVGRDDDHRRAPVRLRVGIGDEHDDPEAGAVGARREPLVRVDHPLVAVAHRAAAQERRVGAGDLGLGHAEERARLAGDERPQPALLLLLGPVQVEDLAVARVGRLAAEDRAGR